MRKIASLSAFRRDGWGLRVKTVASSKLLYRPRRGRITTPHLAFLARLSDTQPESSYVEETSSKTAVPQKYLMLQPSAIWLKYRVGVVDLLLLGANLAC